MKNFIVVFLLIFVLTLCGCNANENLESGNLLENEESKQQEIVDNTSINADEQNNAYLLVKSEKTIENINYEIFENNSVIVKLMNMDETHDYLSFSGENLYTQTSYFVSGEYGKANLIEKDDKTLVELFCDSSIKFCVLKDNILSIVLQSHTYPGTRYNVLNVDIDSQKILSRDNFIKSIERDIKQLESEVNQTIYTLTKEFCKEMKSVFLDEELELYQSQSYFKENFDFSKVSFYYNELGHLSFNFETYFGIPGAGTAKYLYDLETGKVIERIFGF